MTKTEQRREKSAQNWKAVKASKPTIAERCAAEPRTCPNCAAEITRREGQRGPRATFCSAECKKEHNNRELAEGRAVIAYLKAWRVDRGAGEIAKEAFAEMSRIADYFNAQDRAAGRPRADYYAALKLEEGLRYADRRR